MNRIKELRTRRGLKQDELGQMLNVKRATVSKYETGRIPLTAQTISLLCDIFDVSADYIIGREETSAHFEKTSVSNEIHTLISSCSDLTEEELNKVIEYIDFLKTRR